MIQINLLNRKPIIHGIPSPKEGIRFAAVILAAAVIGAAGAVFAFKALKGNSAEKGPVTFNSEHSAKASSAPGDTGLLIDSVSSTAVSDTSLTRYSDMTMKQRLTYEHLFCYYLFRELARIVPSDVDFTSLSMHGYETVIGMGVVKSEESTVSLFSALKQKGWELQPKPASLFRSVGSGFQFRFEGIYQVEPSVTDSLVIPESSIPTQDHLQELKDTLTAVIARSPIKQVGAIEPQEPEIEGKYRHYRYTLSGESSFGQFKDLLKEMKNSTAPISVSDAELEASGSGLKWKITVRITVI